MICIGCPMGCTLTVTPAGDDFKVEGNLCKVGEKYAKEEMRSPKRNLTSSVQITGSDLPLLSVKTERPVPKAAIMDCMRALQGISVTAPVHIGDVIVPDAAGTGVAFVATREAPYCDRG